MPRLPAVDPASQGPAAVWIGTVVYISILTENRFRVCVFQYLALLPCLPALPLFTSFSCFFHDSHHPWSPTVIPELPGVQNRAFDMKITAADAGAW